MTSTDTDSLWFRPAHVPRRSRLLQALPTPASVAPTPPAPPGPPSVAAIMSLVRQYGTTAADSAIARHLGEDVAHHRAQHRAAGLYELIEHNISSLDGWLSGFRILLSELQKGPQL